MPGGTLNTTSHDEDHKHSYAVLQAARDAAAASTRKYDSNATRKKLIEEFGARTGGKAPYDWQLDVAEALLLGVDCTVIAGTGSGKTMPFVMPTFIEREKIYFVISPLNALEKDQAGRFAALGIEAVVLNSTTYSLALLKVWRVLALFASRIGAFIIDEAHCITQWGGDFREDYGTLQELRSLVPTAVPMLATSATITPLTLANIRNGLCIRRSHLFHLNLGNDRVNIKQEVRFMRSGSDYEALDFIVRGASEAKDIPRTIVFVNEIFKCHAAVHRLRQVVGSALGECIGFLHALREESAKHDSWVKFQRGDVRVWVATEAAAMGMDIPDIELVVQFGVPENLSIWLQRAGRAGRDPRVAARAIMLVQAAVIQEVKPKKNSTSTTEEAESSDSDFWEEEEHIEDSRRPPKTIYKKKIEDALREWIQTQGCRRAVVDAYFNNPPRVNATLPSSQCCDNCAMKASPIGEPGASKDEKSAHTLLDTEIGIEHDDEDESGSSSSVPLSPKRRKDDHLKNVKAALLAWRLATRRSKYAGTSLKADSILPDRTLQTIASKHRGIKTIDDLRVHLKPSWALLEVHGAEVLEIVKKLDREDFERRKSRNEQAREARK
ncbi:P-loop containing nucleoside triphosphate hydrolase protein [Trametes polyzona]|nr:P-loop containing nucleoside triphosphate hydrolase protein [Trametes polyzona]